MEIHPVFILSLLDPSLEFNVYINAFQDDEANFSCDKNGASCPEIVSNRFIIFGKSLNKTLISTSFVHGIISPFRVAPKRVPCVIQYGISSSSKTTVIVDNKESIASMQNFGRRMPLFK